MRAPTLARRLSRNGGAVPKGFLAEGKAAPPKHILPPRGRDNGALRASTARTDWLSTIGMPIHGPREPQGVKGAERHVPQEKASGIKRPQRLQQGPRRFGYALRAQSAAT